MTKDAFPEDFLQTKDELKKLLAHALPKIKELNAKQKSGDDLTAVQQAALVKYKRIIFLLKASKKINLF
ncbi:MAG: hypothetical protein PHV30_00805 [Candidatus Margulisbacteria bacterium]|nr:hypothetical protein [Candidatus Margulisiibacteriota bacterium]